MKRVAKVALTIGTMLSVAVYLLSCLTAYISPAHFWPLTFLSLGFPFIALGYLLLVFIWLFIKKEAALYLAIIFLAGFTNLSSILAINLPSSETTNSNTKPIRILGWNVRYFDNNAIHADSPMATRRLMLNYIKETNADVLCLQEFAEYHGPSFLSNIKSLQQMGYKYYYYPQEIKRNYSFGLMVTGNVIFSKHPIIDSGGAFFNDPSYREVIAYADIQINHKVIRFISTHFRSYHFNPAYVDPAGRVPLHFDSSFIYTASKYEKLRAFDKEHAVDSKIAQAQIRKSPHPVIFSADLNSVSTSYAYHTVSKNMQDAFLKKGSGLGGSMDSMMKTLRIDVLLTDKNFCIERYTQDKLSLSDHYPHYIDVTLKQ
ncbi:MAG: endonuclease/exonuclease/phosphatase [Segetibacter sp.]|nr:endonuclease/exonuclease/phosphatase [Segetibacter sp.]